MTTGTMLQSAGRCALVESRKNKAAQLLQLVKLSPTLMYAMRKIEYEYDTLRKNGERCVMLCSGLSLGKNAMPVPCHACV